MDAVTVVDAADGADVLDFTVGVCVGTGDGLDTTVDGVGVKPLAVGD